MTKQMALAMPVAIMLAGCGGGGDDGSPFGAPIPDNPQQVFVDLDGCRWWVIGNATDRTWAPQTDATGKQICDPAAANDGLPINPATPQAAPEPISASVATQPAVGAPTQLTPSLSEEALTPEPDTAAPAPEPAPAAVPAPTPAANGFIVQVATFAAQVNAIAASENFAAQGLPVLSDPSRAGNDGFYRLELGPFASSSQAENALLRARAEGFSDAFVRRR